MRTYDRTTVLFHWIVGIAVLAQFALGWWMIDIPKDPPGVRAWWFNVHKSIGITLAAFVVIRLLWRLSHPAPVLPGTLPRLQRIAATTTHWALYACMVIMPASGYLGSSFTRYPIKYFGNTLPHWGWDWPAAKTLLSAIHFTTACILGALIALHVAAALWHLLRRDGLFSRMWPWEFGDRHRIRVQAKIS
jgi:cytochrome b561